MKFQGEIFVDKHRTAYIVEPRYKRFKKNKKITEFTVFCAFRTDNWSVRTRVCWHLPHDAKPLCQMPLFPNFEGREHYYFCSGRDTTRIWKEVLAYKGKREQIRKKEAEDLRERFAAMEHAVADEVLF